MPFSVDINLVFVVDLYQVSSVKDVYCDDMGVYAEEATRAAYMYVCRNMDLWNLYPRKTKTDEQGLLQSLETLLLA